MSKYYHMLFVLKTRKSYNPYGKGWTGYRSHCGMPLED